MGIKPSFKKSDIDAHIKKKLVEIDRKIIARLRVLGEMCVNRSRSEGGNDPSAFPITYGNSKNKKPLSQRVITRRDTDKNPGVKAPAFGDFLSQTGNAKNSISYFILRDGAIVDQNLGSEETSTALNIAKQRAKNVRRGYALVVVAGVQYAEYLEAMGYDVISSAEVFAKKEMSKIMTKLNSKL
ncbi:hypothetical protein [Dyadobacter sp. LHD-138]|uniref:hypothetical protein n=1 Tax=Dyadobacter sp. LHD-138 TaxID=3071413 RepID=UPI0027E01B61|nr:hypothetical protein [Dyadobacter sp. LHD-138]MDQ6482334.1 hypothetical protein [Dyadobacter sp. LHD-138]